MAQGQMYVSPSENQTHQLLNHYIKQGYIAEIISYFSPWLWLVFLPTQVKTKTMNAGF